MKSKRAITRFINKHGKTRWLRRLHKRMETKKPQTIVASSGYYMEEILKQYDGMQMKMNRMEEELHAVKQAVERLEARP